MDKIGIYFGSSTGTTEDVAKRLAEIMGVDSNDVHDVAKAKSASIENYDVLLLGTSTWGSGELQDDWFDFLIEIEVMNLKGKTIALFGCGDESMSDTFNGAVGVLYERLQKTGAKFVGSFDASPYSFDESPAFIDGAYVGLLLDEVNHSDVTDDRLKEWTEKVKEEITQ